jgi:N utilization substance protein A
MPGLTSSLVQKLNAAGITTVEQLANLSPEELENIPGIGEKTIEKISDALSEYYTQSPAYQDQMERLAQQHMFSKDEPVPEQTEPAAEQAAEAEETGEQRAPEE